MKYELLSTKYLVQSIKKKDSRLEIESIWIPFALLILPEGSSRSDWYFMLFSLISYVLGLYT